jgi:hypothetical protein
VKTTIVGRWVITTGGRSYANAKVVEDALDLLNPGVVVQGDANGADALAKRWAYRHCVPCLSVPANWFKYGRGAGPRRNTRMLDLTIQAAGGVDNVVVAVFPGGPGTMDCRCKAERRGLSIRAFE